jgi:hypothetical protein
MLTQDSTARAAAQRAIDRLLNLAEDDILDRGLDVPQPWPSTGAREAVAVVVDLMRTQAVDAIFAAVETAGRRAVMGEVA